MNTGAALLPREYRLDFFEQALWLDHAQSKAEDMNPGQTFLESVNKVSLICGVECVSLEGV
jgi:hypothetical protein